MSSAKFNSRLVWNGVTTETVAASTLKVGDAVYKGADLAPWRIRHLDRFPDGHVNVVASPATVLDRVDLEGSAPSPRPTS